MKKEKRSKKHYFSTILILLIFLLVGLIAYARYIGTSGLIVKEYIIENERIPNHFDGFKIVHFTDLHFGSTVFLPEVEHLVKKINELKPHVVIFTGDLIDSNYSISESNLEKLVNTLNKIDAQLDKFLVPGGHDQIPAFEKALEDLEFKALLNESQLFYYQEDTPIRIIGISDIYPGFNTDYAFLFEEDEEDDYYTIVLAHEPDVFERMRHHHIDLFLAGHSHGGQVRLPFTGALVKNHGARLYYEEMYQIDGTQMFISSGVGTSQLPFRLFNRPSINFYRFFAQ